MGRPLLDGAPGPARLYICGMELKPEGGIEGEIFCQITEKTLKLPVSVSQ